MGAGISSFDEAEGYSDHERDDDHVHEQDDVGASRGKGGDRKRRLEAASLRR